MSGAGDEMRRLLPPPRRRPGPLTILIRWRVELTLLAALAGLWQLAGRAAVVWLAVGLLALTALPAVHRGVLDLLNTLIVPHRVRSGLIQAGVAGRRGHLPWLVLARPRGDAVVVHVWLHSGTTIEDLRQAELVLTTACGAADVLVAQPSARQDRAWLIVARPRWGWLTR